MATRARLTAAIMAGVLIIAANQAQAGGDPIGVCIGQGGKLRIVEPTVPCAADEQKKLLAEWEPETTEAPDPDETSLKRSLQNLSNRIAALEGPKPPGSGPDKTEALNIESLSQRIDSLASRLDAIPNTKPGSRGNAIHRVTAPFEVVSASGTVILRVSEKVSSNQGEGARVSIGPGDSGNYALRVYKDGTRFVTGIGQAAGGSGLVVVMDESGQTAAVMNGLSKSVSVYDGENAVASMVGESRGGTIAVYNGKTPIAYLTRSTAGDGGNVTVSLNNGFGVFSAGAAQDGAGEACVNRRTQAGTARPACLGLGLPSAGMGK